ncbi:hypothetical protein ABPG75_000670 [Micractinium tetrahymenae]
MHAPSRPQQAPQPPAGAAAEPAARAAAAFPPVPAATDYPPCPPRVASSDPASAPALSFGVPTPPLPAALPAAGPGLCDWLGAVQPPPASPAVSFEPPLPLPQQAPVTPSGRQAATLPPVPLLQALPADQRAAALQLLQQLLLPALAALPTQQPPEAAQQWQQAWQPVAAVSSSEAGLLEQPAAPAGAEAEAVAAAAAVLAMAAEASSSGAASAVPAASAAPSSSATPPPPPPPRDDAPLPFQPHSTPSVQAALGAQLPRGQAIRGARDQSGVWQAWIHYNKKQAFVGRLGRQAAAVAADLVLAWQRRCLTAKVAEKAAARQYNIPTAQYEQDGELMAQLSLVGSADQMKQFVQAEQQAAAATPAASEQQQQLLLLPLLHVAAHPAGKAHARKQAVPRRAPTPDSPTAGRDPGEPAFKRQRSDDEAESMAEH